VAWADEVGCHRELLQHGGPTDPIYGRCARSVTKLDAALIVDEAHSIGVFGPQGRGRACAAGIRPDVLVGTLERLWRPRSLRGRLAGPLPMALEPGALFCFLDGPEPLLARSVTLPLRRRVATMRVAKRLEKIGGYLRSSLVDCGIPVATGEGPILPAVMGTEGVALLWSRRLAERGILVQAIRPPTVPAGTSRLRITARAEPDRRRG